MTTQDIKEKYRKLEKLKTSANRKDTTVTPFLDHHNIAEKNRKHPEEIDELTIQ
jgi:hypothetical protein